MRTSTMTDYSSEFKTEIILILVQNQLSLEEIEHRYGIAASQIDEWKAIFFASASAIFLLAAGFSVIISS